MIHPGNRMCPQRSRWIGHTRSWRNKAPKGASHPTRGYTHRIICSQIWLPRQAVLRGRLPAWMSLLYKTSIQNESPPVFH